MPEEQLKKLKTQKIQNEDQESVRSIEAPEYSERHSSETHDELLDKDLKKSDFQKIILNWNPKWLEQQIGRPEPPPVHKPWTLRRIEKNFSDWRDHQTTFLPLMMLELWNNISTEYDKEKQGRPPPLQALSRRCL